MAHPFLLKDIAAQAGVSLATVDRVLHGRPNVRAHTVRRVEQAIQALEGQRRQIGLAGRKVLIDLVMESPDRFSRAVRRALEAEMALLSPAVLRARYALQAQWRPDALVAQLDAIAHRGSHGVLLKAPDLPEVAAAVDRLVALGIPVLTLVTDLPASRRLAYVGMDNRACGATAAYLIGQWLGGAATEGDPPGVLECPSSPPGVLVSLSSVRFRGEEERVIGFRQALQRDHPRWAVVDVSEGHGEHDRTVPLVRQRLRAHPEVAAVYSSGGANAAILEAFALEGRRCACFIGHDLDEDNLALLRAGRISAVLHHDLRHDMRQACLRLLAALGVPGLDEAARGGLSSVAVITPWNLPQAVG